MALKGLEMGRSGLDARVPVSIIGAGAFAQGLCSSAVKSGAAIKYDICMASRKVPLDSTEYLDCLPEVPIISVEQAINRAALLIVALPAHALASFVESYRCDLSNKVRAITASTRIIATKLSQMSIIVAHSMRH